MIFNLQVVLACFDEADDAAAAEAAEAAEAATAVAAAAAAKAAAAKGTPKVFTQDDVNKFLAEDRRKHTQKYEQLEGAYKEALENQNLTSEQRTQLEGKLDELQKTFRSKEQQLELEKKQWEDKYSKEVKEWETKATTWEGKYKESVMARALQDAAIVNDAFSPSQIVALLRPMTKIVEKTDDQGKGTGVFEPAVDLTDIDTKTGESMITRRTPEDAVKRMKELPTLFGNLFKANVVSGVGAGSATGGANSGTGRADARKITTEQYMELRKKDPKALGLKEKIKT